MYIEVSHTDSGIYIFEYSPEQAYTKKFFKNSNVYKKLGHVFRGSFIKFQVIELHPIDWTTAPSYLPELDKYHRNSGGLYSYAKYVDVPAELLDKYEDRIINYGHLLTQQRDVDKYTFEAGVYFVEPEQYEIKNVFYSGTIKFEQKGYTNK